MFDTSGYQVKRPGANQLKVKAFSEQEALAKAKAYISKDKGYGAVKNFRIVSGERISKYADTVGLNEEKYFSDIDRSQYDLGLNELDSALYLWEHQAYWTISTLDRFLDEIMPILGYTKISEDGQYPEFTNNQYDVKREALKCTGGYCVHLYKHNEDYPIDGISGIMESTSKFAHKPDFRFENLKDFIHKIESISNSLHVENKAFKNTDNIFEALNKELLSYI